MSTAVARGHNKVKYDHVRHSWVFQTKTKGLARKGGAGKFGAGKPGDELGEDGAPVSAADPDDPDYDPTSDPSVVLVRS